MEAWFNGLVDVRKIWQDRIAARTATRHEPDVEAIRTDARRRWHPARYASHYQDCEPLRQLLKTQVDVNQYISEGGDAITCLHMAVNSEEAVELLLRAGADPNRPYLPLPPPTSGCHGDYDNYLCSQAWAGNTPLHLAAEQDNQATVGRLLEAGARLLPNHWGQTPLNSCSGDTLERLLQAVRPCDLPLVRVAYYRTDRHRRQQAAPQLRDFLQSKTSRPSRDL